jgi:HK97 family phage portal protein
MASRCFRCGARSSSAYCAVCTSGLKAIAGPPSPTTIARLVTDTRAVEAKAAEMHFGRGGTRWSVGIGSTEYDYRASVGDSRGNAMVMACVRWAARTFPEAPTIVETKAAKGWEQSDEHPLLSLLARPNPYYSGLHLWSATLADWMLTGNAYWFKRRSGNGRPVELWWIPSSMLEPKWPDDGMTFIGWYDYTVEGQVYPADPADVVHFRDGFDPANIRKGLSPIQALLREIATDNEAANWTASMLRNVGVPSVVLSPDGDYDVDPDVAEESRDRWVARTTGDRRGGPIFMSGRTKVSVLSFSPEQMQMRDQRRIPEERVSAIFGTPAVVVGLGAGLDRSTYSNMAEAREAAYESMLIPTQRLFAADLNGQLVPNFGDPLRLRIGFDLSKVRVLQDDQNALHERTRGDLVGGLVTLNQAREMIGQDPLPGKDGDVYYIPTGVTVTPADDLLPPEPEPVPAALAPGDEPAAEEEQLPSKGLKQTTVLPMRPPPADPFVPIGADRIVESSELVTVDDWVIDQAVDRWNHDEPALRGILEALANGRNGHAAH